MDEEPITRTATEASGGSKQRTMRYVLLISLSLVIIAMVVIVLVPALANWK